jgi:hypothetical protein
MHTINVNKIARSVEIDFDALPEASKAFVVNYGLKQLLNDSIVSGEDDGERNGLLDKKLDKLREGTLDIRESNRETNPLAREVTRRAELATVSHFAKKGLKKSKVESADWTAVLNKFRVHPTIVAQAEKAVAESAEISLD